MGIWKARTIAPTSAETPRQQSMCHVAPTPITPLCTIP
jgi:hypothetical protein